MAVPSTLVPHLHVTYPTKPPGNENSCNLYHLEYRQVPVYDLYWRNVDDAYDGMAAEVGVDR
jgi:hypothetical protein